MNEIIKISQSQKPNNNQLIRWVNNKEDHAIKIQNIVSQYFLHQRIKLTDPENEAAYKKYHKQLELLHRLLVLAMKCKQTTDLAYIEELRTTVSQFEKSYFQTHNH